MKNQLKNVRRDDDLDEQTEEQKGENTEPVHIYYEIEDDNKEESNDNNNE